MRDMVRALWGVIWPPASPVLASRGSDLRAEQLWWGTLCVFLVIPFTAVWHHAVFYSPTCMLNSFGPDYTPRVVREWLSRDPSLPWAMVTAITLYVLGRNSRRVRVLAAPVFLALLPLSIWIWDIPFTGRVVCYTGHDHRPLPLLGIIMKSRYLYLLGALLYVVLLVATLARRSPGHSDSPMEPAA